MPPPMSRFGISVMYHGQFMMAPILTKPYKTIL